ncbi:MAG: hypothetical protein MUF34_30180 [Polyangiaceae bacterium]|nr:hypothetical protein [Polyangiaceae bacterium]
MLVRRRTSSSPLLSSGVRLLVLAASLTRSGVASAAEGDACVSAYEGAQEARRAGRLLRARSELRLCQRSCPSALATDCAAWLPDVEARVASLRLEARGPAGRPALAGRVLVDRQPLPEGAALATPWELDPGTHSLLIEAPGMRPERRDFFLQNGEHHVLRLELTPTSAVSTPGPGLAARPTPPLAYVAYVTGGAGAIALGVGAFLGLKGHLDASSLRDRCAPLCDQSEVDAISTQWTAGAVVAGVGVVALGAAFWVALARPGETSAKRSSSSGGPAWTTRGPLLRFLGSIYRPRRPSARLVIAMCPRPSEASKSLRSGLSAGSMGRRHGCAGAARPGRTARVASGVLAFAVAAAGLDCSLRGLADGERVGTAGVSGEGGQSAGGEAGSGGGAGSGGEAGKGPTAFTWALGLSADGTQETFDDDTYAAVRLASLGDGRLALTAHLNGEALWGHDEAGTPVLHGTPSMGMGPRPRLFLATYRQQDGAVLAVHEFGGTASTYVTAMVSDGLGNLAVGGYFRDGTLDLGADLVLDNKETGGADGFVAMLDATMRTTWALHVSSSDRSTQRVNALAFGGGGELHVAGEFNGEVRVRAFVPSSARGTFATTARPSAMVLAPQMATAGAGGGESAGAGGQGGAGAGGKGGAGGAGGVGGRGGGGESGPCDQQVVAAAPADRDAFFVRIDGATTRAPSCAVASLHYLGGAGEQSIGALAALPRGVVAVGGSWRGGVLDGVTQLEEKLAANDAFVAAFDAAGALAWPKAFSFGGSNVATNNERVVALGFDGASLIAAGTWANPVASKLLDCPVATRTQHQLEGFALGVDATTGKCVWGASFGSFDVADGARALAIDALGRPVLVGFSTGRELFVTLSKANGDTAIVLPDQASGRNALALRLLGGGGGLDRVLALNGVGDDVFDAVALADDRLDVFVAGSYVAGPDASLPFAGLPDLFVGRLPSALLTPAPLAPP